MPQIEAFRGLRFDPLRAGELAALLCPPYDVISPAERDRYLSLSPYNVVRIELSPDEPGDTPEWNRYTRAAEILTSWRDKGALRQDPERCFYLHSHTFECGDQTYTRRGVFAAVRLQPWESGLVRPHEATMSGPKEDRYRLMTATRANVSPVFAVHRRQPKALESAWRWAESTAPEAEIEVEGQRQQLWVLDDPGVVAAVEAGLAEAVLYIADGHHRYETALRYRDERAASGPLRDDHPASFVLTYIVAMDDPGLVVLPTHRVVRGLDDVTRDELDRLVTPDFDIERRTIELPDQLEDALVDLEVRGRAAPSLGVLGPNPTQLGLLTLRDQAAMERHAPEAPLAWRSVDVAVLHELVLDRLLEHDPLDREDAISYTRDPHEALRAVRTGEAQLAFFLNPPDFAQIASVSDSGARMPEKSTYFYPKVSTGLILRALD